ncbi:MAG: CO dehydrogenase/acetyl-CoA synthase complex subunit alpha [Candidatus Helarchaeota archaeon]
MADESAKIKIEGLKTETMKAKSVEIHIGKIPMEEWKEEPQGPTPMPGIKDLREWDFKLLAKYPPFYAPLCDMCCLCTYGKCDLTGGKHGACGINLTAQQARIVAIACAIGCACHAGHGRHLVHHLIEKFGANTPLQMGAETAVEAPCIRTVCGFKPKTMKDLEIALDYVEREITHVLGAAHTGQEFNALDFESKALHMGMCDFVGMEIADIAQMAGFGFVKGEADAELVEIGLGSIDKEKPVVLMVGHNVAPGVEITNYLRKSGNYGKVEICAICCTAIDQTRYDYGSKIVGSMGMQLRFIRSGIPDLVMVDEQCVRCDLNEEAAKIQAPFIATNEKICGGMRDRSKDNVDQIVDDLVSGREPGALILNADVAGEVAVRVAMGVAPRRKKMKNLPDYSEIKEIASRCKQCEDCMRSCPNNLPIPEAMALAAKGDNSLLEDLWERCVGCGRCEYVCSHGINPHSLIATAGEKLFSEDKFMIRSGRGQVTGTEIRAVGAPLVLGEIPGIIAIVGCANYPNGAREVAYVAEEFLKRRYIVVVTGCSAMDIARIKNEEGKSLYEQYPGDFDAGGLVNIGSCVSNSHIVGAAIKVASIFARRNIRGNFEEIADYILNRVGACGIAWGAMSQKAASIATGCNRFGIPVIIGPHGSKYRRQYLGRSDKDETWEVIDARTGNKVYAGPCPEHLIYAAESLEECIVETAKLCLRPSDNFKGRAVKLTHWIDLHKKYYGCIPSDIDKFIRIEADIPLTLKDEILPILKEKGWTPREIPDPTLLPRLIRKKKE